MLKGSWPASGRNLMLFTGLLTPKICLSISKNSFPFLLAKASFFGASPSTQMCRK